MCRYLVQVGRGVMSDYIITIINFGHTPFISLSVDYYDRCVAYMFNIIIHLIPLQITIRQGISVWGEIDPG